MAVEADRTKPLFALTALMATQWVPLLAYCQCPCVAPEAALPTTTIPVKFDEASTSVKKAPNRLLMGCPWGQEVILVAGRQRRGGDRGSVVNAGHLCNKVVRGIGTSIADHDRKRGGNHGAGGNLILYRFKDELANRGFPHWPQCLPYENRRRFHHR